LKRASTDIASGRDPSGARMNWPRYALASLIGSVTTILFFVAATITIGSLTAFPAATGCGRLSCVAQMQFAWDLIALAGFIGLLIGALVAAVTGIAFYRRRPPEIIKGDAK
jgi:hypothetical protein